jgi:transposase-like protein
VPDKYRRQVAKDLRPIYTAVDADAASEALAAFEASWGERYPMIGKTWRESWEHVIPVLAFPDDVGRVVYTTNTIEALHPQIRKTIKTRGHFLNEDAARKLIYLAITNAQKSWRSTYNGAPHCFHSKSTSENDSADCRSYGSLTNLQSEKGASPCNLASQRRLLHGRPRSSHCSSA